MVKRANFSRGDKKKFVGGSSNQNYSRNKFENSEKVQKFNNEIKNKRFNKKFTKSKLSNFKGKKNQKENLHLQMNSMGEKEEIQVDNKNFFDFDIDTNIINKFKSDYNGSKSQRENASGWSYKNVIQNENEIRKIREKQIREETRTVKSEDEMGENDMMEIEEEGKTTDKNQTIMNEDEDTYNSNNINKYESEVYSKDMSFCDFNLSKLVLKGLANIEYFHPTKVQEKVIPLILRGHDVLVNAETGSGKTACFLLPIIQRIITNKASRSPIRVLIILPTRELAYQCQEMLNSFTKYLEDITSVSICGGMSIDNQINQLKANPDFIIATPGRLIDMLYNYKSTNSFFLDNINILILDEADKLLELGFKDAIMEIINLIKENTNRQTLLFSATLNPKIIDLGKDTLKNPVKVKMNRSAVLTNLKQSIIRMRFKKEENDQNDFEKRMSYVINLLVDTGSNTKNVSKFRSIIFFNTKKECHKAALVLKKFSILASELHSDIPQPQRLQSLDQFQKGNIKYLLCTDIAARGIDVEKVRCVINFQMPLLEDRYIHRIGRTARKGYQGEAITICDEKERQTLRKMLKKENFSVENAVIDNNLIKTTFKSLLGHKPEIEQNIQDDLIEKEILAAEKDVEKTINLKLHHNEIYNKPKKTWFMNKREKKDLRKKITSDIKQKKEE